MAPIARILALLLCATSLLFAQPTTEFTPDSLTRGLWHLNEPSGSVILDASSFVNYGSAIGTTVVPGRFGNARLFNGSSDYIYIPSSRAFDLDTSSFQIDVWFKTTASSGFLLRRGLAPSPGFELNIYWGGKLGFELGNRWDGTWPDTIIAKYSEGYYNDGEWHLATLKRNRADHTVSLYADGALAAGPVNDPILFPISSDRPLTIGCWEDLSQANYFAGSIDEIRIQCDKRYNPWLGMSVNPLSLNFGAVKPPATDTLTLNINNTGTRDTLDVYSASSDNPVFHVSMAGLKIPPGKSVPVMVYYVPASPGLDTGTLAIGSNDPVAPIFSVKLSGQSFAYQNRPVIKHITHPAGTYGQARLIWFRSILDTIGSSDPVTEYCIWRRVPGGGATGTPPRMPLDPSSPKGDPLWDFIQTVPAVYFEEYASLVPLQYDYNSYNPWSVYIISSHTKSGLFYFSAPDSTQYYGPLSVRTNGTPSIPRDLQLFQNYPNPFNPETIIEYGIPESGTSNGAMSAVRLAVYDVLGREVATLVNERQSAGIHSATWNARGNSSGVYFCRLEVNGAVRTTKMYLLK